MTEFTRFEEKNIVLLALESPDFFYRIISFVKPEMFDSQECQYVMICYKDYYEKYDEVPTREMLKNIVYNDLSVDDPVAEPIIKLIDEEIDVRNVPFIKEKVLTWARRQQFSLLYDEDIIAKVRAGEFEDAEKIFDEASKITDVVIKPFKFFSDIDQLFIEEERDYFTTGFPRLDRCFHDKGPARREVFTWIAPTGVGKSILLVNTSVANVLDGKKVLHVSLENSEKITGNRYLGAFSNSVIKTRFDHQDEIKERLRKIKCGTDGELFIVYFPTDTVTVDAVELAVRDLERHYSFRPDVITLDYLECLLSKNPHKNKEDYGRQKAVAAEFRALVAKCDVLGATASQTNRSSTGGQTNRNEANSNINLDKLAESFGKAMPMDYVVSINQNTEEYTTSANEEMSSIIGRFRLFIAKNRNGPKFKTVNARVNYATMKVLQEEAA